eukprot:776265-Pyramimonas_sp.AAC.2
MAPGVASILRGLDAREHSQLKAAIREVKAEMYWAIEQDWIQGPRPRPRRSASPRPNRGPTSAST